MNDTTESRPPRRTVIAIAVVAVVLAAIVFAAGIGLGHSSAGSATAVPSSPSSTVPRAVPIGQASVCGLPGYDPSGSTLTTAPATTWSTVGTMAAPAAAKAGPGRVAADGLRSCYAHTIEGAVIAVANVWAMGTDSRLTRPLLEQQTATGPGRTTALKADTPASNTGLRAQIAGFKVTSYTGTAATVDVAFRLNTGDLVSFPAPVQWQDGDWKYQVADDGSPVFRPSTLTSLSSYIPWEDTE